MTEQQLPDIRVKLQNAIQEVQKVIKGQEVSIKYILTTLIAGGHILIEDNPGSGKTVTARAIAQVLSRGGEAQFKRIQFTPDLLPMDLIGSHIYREQDHEFIFKKGPLFTNILLADEINRASPKVQSALLESMAEGQITVADQTYTLDEVFFVMATQNPIESEGTYPLPQAQLDRFFMKIFFGYVDADTELGIYKEYLNIQKDLFTIQAHLSLEDIKSLRALSQQVYVDNEVINAVNKLIRSTREHTQIRVGASVRAGIALIKCMRAYALINGKDYVSEEELYALAYPVLEHRLVYNQLHEGRKVLQQIIDEQVRALSQIKIK